MWDTTFSLAITPSLDREMFSGSVDAGFILALPFHHRDLEPDCVGVSTRAQIRPSPKVKHSGEPNQISCVSVYF